MTITQFVAENSKLVGGLVAAVLLAVVALIGIRTWRTVQLKKCETQLELSKLKSQRLSVEVQEKQAARLSRDWAKQSNSSQTPPNPADAQPGSALPSPGDIPQPTDPSAEDDFATR